MVRWTGGEDSVQGPITSRGGGELVDLGKLVDLVELGKRVELGGRTDNQRPPPPLIGRNRPTAYNQGPGLGVIGLGGGRPIT